MAYGVMIITNTKSFHCLAFEPRGMKQVVHGETPIVLRILLSFYCTRSTLPWSSQMPTVFARSADFFKVGRSSAVVELFKMKIHFDDRPKLV